ncbi:MAG: lysylphosphatidylglycerol synthase domain-containing protein [Thiohalocapsa sp.]
MKALPLVIAGVGLAAMLALVGYYGLGAVLDALVAVGAGGFAAICAIHLGLIAVMGLAWRALLPRAPTGAVMWARLVRDSAAEALPLSQVGGYVLGARALAVAGVSGTLAAASTIVDVTLEFVAQLAYTALGLAWLVRLQPETRAAAPVLIGLVVAAGAAGAFVLVQRRGYGFVERIAQAIGQGVGKGWAERSAAGAAALHAALAAIYRRQPGLWANFALHLFCWIASAAEVWLALWLAGETLPWGAVLAIESLLYAIRTAAFVVPQAVGVQEGAYLLLGAAFGLTPEMALALSLLKRARDLVIGLPAIAVWQAIEGGRLWRRRSVRPGERLGEMPPGE